jgi:hypothetical protein
LASIRFAAGDDNAVARSRERNGSRAAYSRECSSDHHDSLAQVHLLENILFLGRVPLAVALSRVASGDCTLFPLRRKLGIHCGYEKDFVS